MADLMQQRRDLEANWASVNPILPEGQVGYATDTQPWKGKVGDGKTHWNDLPYTNAAADLATSSFTPTIMSFLNNNLTVPATIEPSSFTPTVLDYLNNNLDVPTTLATSNFTPAIITYLNSALTVPGTLTTSSFTSDIMTYLNTNLTVGGNKYPLVTVMDFGAVNDGATDNSAAFQNAYNACTANGLVVVPPGKWNLTTLPTGTKAVRWSTDGATDLAGNPLSVNGVQETMFNGRKLISKLWGAAADYSVVDIQRNAYYDGGTAGYVNNCLKVSTSATGNQSAFEWALTAVVSNSSSGSGENVGIYGQGLAQIANASPTWAGCFECKDNSNSANPTRARIGLEVDNFGNGGDAYSSRIGIDLVIGRSNASGAQHVVSHGIRLGAQGNSDANGYFISGITMNNQYGRCMDIKPSGATVGIDFSNGSFSSSAIRLAANQHIALDATSAHKLQWSSTGGCLNYSNNGVSLLQVNDSGTVNIYGALTINGNQMLSGGAVPNGFGTPTGAQTIYNFPGASASLAQTSAQVAGILLVMQYHGLIKY